MTYEEKVDRFLNTVKETLLERNDEYGDHENFFIGMAHGMNAILLPKLKDKVTKADALAVMQLLKAIRIAQAPTHIDSYVDSAGYATLAGMEAQRVGDYFDKG